MAGMGPIVVNTGAGIEVKGRRRLGDSAQFESMLEELLNKVQEKATEEKGGLIADLDISQNKLTFEQFENLFTQLGANNARVKNFRMFGCATLDDNVMKVIADYLRLLSSDSAPMEMHLSDCAITTVGWDFLISAIEETELYPVAGQFGGPAKPLYLRLENNYIAEETIREKIDAGTVRAYNKANKWEKPHTTGTIKVNLVVTGGGSIQQRKGEPPAPQDAPAPKNVFDKQARDAQGGYYGPGGVPPAYGKGAAVGPCKGGGAPWGGGGAWGGCGGKGPIAMVRPMTPRMALPGASYGGAASYGGMTRPGVASYGGGGVAQIIRPAAATMRTPATIKPLQGAGMYPPAGAGAARGTQRISPASSVLAPPANVWARGTSGSAVDRSRTPVSRAPTQPAKPPPQKTSDLPFPWEEHWSEEYQIPYFWNSENGESAWERPTA